MRNFLPFRLLILSLIAIIATGLYAQDGNRAGDTPSPIPYDNVFTHQAASDTLTSNQTRLDHPLINENENAALFVTPLYGSTAVYVDQAIGVWMNGLNQWTIFNQNNTTPLPTDSMFNVQVQNLGSNVFQHVKTDPLNITLIDHPLTNNNPNALVFITPLFTDTSDVYVNAPVGVYYRETNQKWAIFSQDALVGIPANAAFNVQVLNASDLTFVHKVTPANYHPFLNHVTVIDHPLLNNNPFARLIITQNWNPGNVGGVYNDHHIGVWYDTITSRWTIFNQDTVALPENAAFNVNILDDGFNGAEQRLVNGSFEVTNTSKKNAIGWTRFPTNTSRRVCNNYTLPNIVAYGGECALKLTGTPGVISTVSQTYTPTETNNFVSFQALVKGNGLTAGGVVMAKLTTTAGEKFKLRLDSGFINGGTYDWIFLRNMMTLPNPLQKAKIIIRMTGSSGKMFVDNVVFTHSAAVRSVDHSLVSPTNP